MLSEMGRVAAIIAPGYELPYLFQLGPHWPPLFGLMGVSFSTKNEAHTREPAMKLKPVEIFMIIAVAFTFALIILNAITGL